MSLSPSQRITLIKEIAQRLSTEDWYLIDLTLKQFGFSVSETWGGNGDAYVMTMLFDLHY